MTQFSDHISSTRVDHEGRAIYLEIKEHGDEIKLYSIRGTGEPGNGWIIYTIAYQSDIELSTKRFFNDLVKEHEIGLTRYIHGLAKISNIMDEPLPSDRLIMERQKQKLKLPEEGTPA